MQEISQNTNNITQTPPQPTGKNAGGWMADKEKKANIYFMKAKYEIDDEFYTSYDEIRIEMEDYKLHFKDKVVVCPCNDGLRSNFYHYFLLNLKS